MNDTLPGDGTKLSLRMQGDDLGWLSNIQRHLDVGRAEAVRAAIRYLAPALCLGQHKSGPVIPQPMTALTVGSRFDVHLRAGDEQLLNDLRRDLGMDRSSAARTAVRCYSAALDGLAAKRSAGAHSGAHPAEPALWSEEQ
jgi:hypothetical protein